MCFGIEDHFVEVHGAFEKEKIEVLEGLRKEKTLHRIRFLFSDYTPERCVALVGAAMLHEIAKELLAHPQIDSAAA
jgi:hypothetical protein